MADNDDFDDFFQDVPEATEDHEGDETPIVLPPRLGLLADVSRDEFDQIARSAQLKHLEEGQAVFEQGDAAERFYILVDGNVVVERDNEVLATLGPGSFFGESALLVTGNRSATVRATTPISIWSVGYDVFTRVVSGHLLADGKARSEAVQRLATTPPELFS